MMEDDTIETQCLHFESTDSQSYSDRRMSRRMYLVGNHLVLHIDFVRLTNGIFGDCWEIRFLESYKNIEDSADAYTTVHLNITHRNFWSIYQKMFQK